MPSLSDRIRRFRQRVERDASAPPDEPENGSGDGSSTRRPSKVVRRVREGVERGQAAAEELKRRGETDLKRAQDRIERRVVPLEHEARETRREAGLLGETLAAPVKSRAEKAADELRELRDEANELREKVSDPLEAQRQGLKEEADVLKEQFGGLNTDLDDLGTDVEQPLLFDTIDDPDEDGDLFETIDDPLDDVEDPLAESDVDLDASVFEVGRRSFLSVERLSGQDDDFEEAIEEEDQSDFEKPTDTLDGLEDNLSRGVEEDFDDL